MIKSISKQAIICDLDEVLICNPPNNSFEQFYKQISDGIINDWCLAMLQGFHLNGFKILFLTSRDCLYKVHTTNLLNNSITFPYELYMRGRQDLRPSWELKQEQLDFVKDKYEIILALDDDINNIEMYKKNGIKTLLVA